MSKVTCIAPVNIAVVKYWGKRDEDLILPINDSISTSLSTDDLCTKTTVMIDPEFQTDRIWLNGREESMDNKRLQNCLREIRKRAKLSPEMQALKIHICSENNFPTAAGLASSAAGYACLAYALAKLYKVEGDISAIARMGSGSACRSTLGGFVQWHMGSDPAGTDSVASEIAPASHWPEMRILVLVVNDSQKKTSSATGMKRCVETSQLLRYRAEKIVPRRVEEMRTAIESRDFAKFAEHTIKDSNQMHATALDAYPPISYLTDVSQFVFELVHAYNAAVGTTRLAYTADAGPNVVLYLLEEDVDEVLRMLNHFLPRGDVECQDYYGDAGIDDAVVSTRVAERVKLPVQEPGRLKRIICTRVGDGPKVLEDEREVLLDSAGMPISLGSCKAK